MVNLDSKLENRDVVEVLTRREPAPNRDWLTIVKTSAAKNKIRAWFRAVSRDTNMASGRALMDMELKVLHKGRLEDIPAAKLAAGLELLRAKTVDDVLVMVGEGMLTPSQAVRKLLPDVARPASVPVVRRPETTGKVIFESEQLPYHLAPCCSPIFPQPLMGYVTRGEGVTVHALGCRNTPVEIERLVTPRWETTERAPEMLLCGLSIHGHNRVGFLSDVTGLVAEKGLNIGQISSRPLDSENGLQTEIKFSVEVPDLFMLADIMRRIEKLPGIISVERV
jgi:GTP pyrophosphokinase